MKKLARIVYSFVLAPLVTGALALSLPRLALADDAITPPAVPGDLQVQPGNVPFLVGHAFGTQNYVCLPAGAGFAWTLFTPQATLFDARGKQLITHFFSPTPDQARTFRATWQHSKDTSAVWAKLVGKPFDAPPFVAPGAIPWLLLERAGVAEGPTGGGTLAATTFIQRVNTAGGVAPPTGCGSLADVGAKAFVPYTADYVFYENPGAADGS